MVKICVSTNLFIRWILLFTFYKKDKYHFQTELRCICHTQFIPTITIRIQILCDTIYDISIASETNKLDKTWIGNSSVLPD